MLGGKDNFAADRAFVDEAMRIAPKAPLAARANRAFLRRVVRYLTGEAGISQFLDLGSGLPTQGNVSEVAHEMLPELRVATIEACAGLRARTRDPAQLRRRCRPEEISGRAWRTPLAHRGE